MGSTFLGSKCVLSPLDGELWTECKPFSCGDDDLDDFFRNDADNFSRQLLGKSFCYRLEEDMSVVVCAFTLSTASMDVRRLPRNRRDKLTRKIPHEKSLSSYPAVLICRLGVSVDFRGLGIGTDLMENVIKPLFQNFRIGCRYLTVDAYNNPASLRFYEANGFNYLFVSEQQEKDFIGLRSEQVLRTRLMYFDLIRLPHDNH
jgi:GNAT superfamily N-acetyltransferase